MNHIYRTIWNEKTGTFVAVSELTKSSGKKASAMCGEIAGAGLALALRTTVASLLIGFAMPLWALPNDGVVTAGSASVSSGPSNMTINQTSQNVALNWQSFSIGQGEAVQFVQPNSSSVALNRVLGADPSNILGSLSANGQVFLVNPNGILFGQGASVNVGGLVASTLDISDRDFMAGEYNFKGSSAAGVLNQGRISADGGYVALLGAHVSNQGVIAARMGTVALAAGEAMTLDVAGDGLLNVGIDQGAVDALVANGGLIQADGGQVLMTAQTAGNLLNTVVNNTGIIQAQTIENRDGVIRLLGDMKTGTVNVAGTLDASAPTGGDGGFIDTSAARVTVADDTKVTTAAAQGLTGSWLIDPTDYTIAATGGDITGAVLSANLTSTSITIQSISGATSGVGDINVNDEVSWYGSNKLTLNARNDINIRANMSVKGSGGLALEFGQGALAADNTSDIITMGGVVNLFVLAKFTTKQGSDGAVKSYYVIPGLGPESSNKGLQGMNGNKNYVLGANIDASATSGWNEGAGFRPIGDSDTPYTGTFNGLGHTISNLTINRPTTEQVGLFGQVGTGGRVQNVGLVGGSITGGSNTGALIGFNEGTVSNSYATGAVTGTDAVGGLVGMNYGTVSNSHATGAVTATGGAAGGLSGFNAGTISNSYASGAVEAVGSYSGGLLGTNQGVVTNSHASGAVKGNSQVGGLVGSDYGGSVDSSYATGAVTGETRVGGLLGFGYESSVNNSYASGVVTGNSRVGGLMGFGYKGSVNNSYASGVVTGNSQLGGLLGAGDQSSISNSYATGAVTGDTEVGGLAGYVGYTSVDNSYATGAVSGETDFGGLLGRVNGTDVTASYWDTDSSNQANSAGGIGMTTADMQTLANFSSATAANGNVNPDWDMANTWVVYEGHTSPLLRSFMTALTVTANAASKTYDGLAYSGGNGVTYSTTPNSNLLGTLSYGGTSQGARNAGSYTLTGSGLYSNQQGYLIDYVAGALTVTPKALTVSGMLAADKPYDGTTAATLSGGTLVGLVGTETLAFSGHSGTFADASVGTDKAVTVAGMVLADGTGLAANYSISNPQGLTADITKVNTPATPPVEIPVETPVDTPIDTPVDTTPAANSTVLANAITNAGTVNSTGNSASSSDAQSSPSNETPPRTDPGGFDSGSLTGLSLTITGLGLRLPDGVLLSGATDEQELEVTQ